MSHNMLVVLPRACNCLLLQVYKITFLAKEGAAREIQCRDNQYILEAAGEWCLHTRATPIPPSMLPPWDHLSLAHH